MSVMFMYSKSASGQTKIDWSNCRGQVEDPGPTIDNDLFLLFIEEH